MTPELPLVFTSLRHSIRRNRAHVIVTAVLVGASAIAAIWFLRWAVLDAVWTLPPGADSSACRAVAGRGACWAVVSERSRFILFGSYPSDQHWRPALACVMFAALYMASAVRAWWRLPLAALWVVVPVTAVMLILGGIPGLTFVPTEVWGGLPLTLVLSTVGFEAAIPLGVVLALGRRSAMPAIRVLSVAYIELIRGVPLITFLFMASLMFPLFVPEGLTVDKLLRAQIALVLVVAAYLAEVIRGGLQAIPAGQHEAAASMGLNYWQSTFLIVLPQALRVSIPALVNTFIAFFKDTSLVAIIGMFDLLGAAQAVNVDPKWFGFGVEVYLFAGAVYFVFCFAVSRYTQRLERIQRVA